MPSWLCRFWYVFAFQLPWLPELVLRAGDYGVFDSMFSRGPVGCKRRDAVTQQVGAQARIVLLALGVGVL